jgi:hypothetical protein
MLLVFIISNPGADSRWLVLLSLIFPIYYMVISWVITLRLRTKH